MFLFFFWLSRSAYVRVCTKERSSWSYSEYRVASALVPRIVAHFNKYERTAFAFHIGTPVRTCVFRFSRKCLESIGVLHFVSILNSSLFSLSAIENIYHIWDRVRRRINWNSVQLFDAARVFLLNSPYVKRSRLDWKFFREFIPYLWWKNVPIRLWHVWIVYRSVPIRTLNECQF